jgi:protein SCO1/2
MAVVEAGGGRVGTSFDKVVLSCYRYDPATRRYAPFVMGFMRIGALTVLFALAGLLTVLWRKEIAMRKRATAAVPKHSQGAA